MVTAGVVGVRWWTGREIRALRLALRLPVPVFAERLGVSARTITQWESQGDTLRMHTVVQALLDTVLRLAGGEVHTRFTHLLSPTPAAQSGRVGGDGARSLGRRGPYRRPTLPDIKAMLAATHAGCMDRRRRHFTYSPRAGARWVWRFPTHPPGTNPWAVRHRHDHAGA